jgi:hypothetical protein
MWVWKDDFNLKLLMKNNLAMCVQTHVMCVHMFLHSKSFDNFQECGFKWTYGTFPIKGESTLGWAKQGNYNVHFGRFSSVFLNVENWTKMKKALEMIIKLAYFSMSKLMML